MKNLKDLTGFVWDKCRIKTGIAGARKLGISKNALAAQEDFETMKAIKSGKEDIKKQRLVSWEKIKEDLGL